MAATISGVFPVCLEQEQACKKEGETRQKQVALMEKLRSRGSLPSRSWTDIVMKSFRSTVVERKVHTENTERTHVHDCLYTLERTMKVISQQSLLERLEGVAQHRGLTFGVYGGDPPSISLQADMFHIEITLNKGGGVKEVKVAHQGEASICPELTDILNQGDFLEFTTHVEGLQSIYGVTGEKKLKSKVFLALHSLEKDLNDLAQFQSSISGVANYIHKSALGILLPRTAGKPMKLIYFVSPYDLLDKKTMSAHPMTVEAIAEHGLGRSVTVCLEPGPTNKLQTMPLMSANVSKSSPSFNGLTNTNSANLPACFVLVLPQPIPVAMSVVHNIHSLTKLDTGKENGNQSLLSLILDSNSDGKVKNDQQLFVSLPDQNHRYFINGVSCGVLEKPGVMLSRIPFSHPTHVPKILVYLRRQLLFNSLLASCVRPAAKKDTSCNLVFELTVISLTKMTVVFEHPAHDAIVTVDIDMSDLTNPKCSLLCDEEHRLCSDDTASHILQRCLSLPVLMRALVQKGRGQLEKMMAEAKARAEEQAQAAREAALWAAAQLRQQQQARLAPNIPTKGRPPPPQPPPPHLTPSYPPTPSPITSNPPSVGDRRGMGTGTDLLITSPPGYPSVMGSAGDMPQNNPLLVDLLDNGRSGVNSPSLPGQGQQSMTESPMLSQLLEDHISVATNITPMASNQGTLQQAQPKPKVARGRKRRSQAELPVGRSPKHRVSDSDTNDRFNSIDFESSSSPFESSLAGGSGSMPGFHHPMGPTPPRPSSRGQDPRVIDLTEENVAESSLKKLVDFSIESIKPRGATSESELHNLLSQQEHNNSSSTTGMKPNQMTGSKNENASTSPEGLLIGSGEVGKASLPDPTTAYTKVRSSSRCSTPPALNAVLGHGQVSAKARRDSDPCGYHQQQPSGPFASQQDYNSMSQQVLGVGGTGVGVSAGSVATPVARPRVVSSSSMTEVLDIKPNLPHGKKMGPLKTSLSTEYAMDNRSLFEKFQTSLSDFTGQIVSSPHVTITSSTVTPAISTLEGDDMTTPKVKLKLHHFRNPHGKGQSIDTGVVQSPSSAGSKSSNSNTFEFCSDEEDDAPISINYASTERLSVYSSSPTRLQISSKAKLPTPEMPLAIKPEKYKRKDKSSGTTKRKREKEESKKEKKKKKFDHDLYLPMGKETMYRSSTVESDQKSGTKLKIRVSKEHIKMPSPSKDSGRTDANSEKIAKFSEKVNDVFKKRSSSSSPTVEKLVLQKQDVRENSASGLEGGKDRDAGQLYRPAVSASGKSVKIAGGGKGSVNSSNNALSKTDPKLAKALIRLKPISISSSTSTSVSVTHSVKTVSSGRGMSERSERRSQSSSTCTAISTPTSSTMSLASILPNAPTASSVASLPPIPKRPKVSAITTTSSNTSTNAKSSPGIPNNSSNAKSNPGVPNNSSKNFPFNSNYNSSVGKISGNSPGIGGRSGSNPNTPNSLKSSGMGFNKTGTPPGILKTSPNMPGYKSSKDPNMLQGILKNSGHVGQGNTNSLRTASGNQGVQKGSGNSSQFSNNACNRGPNSSNAQGPQKSNLSTHGGTKNMQSQGGNAFKGSGIHPNVGRGAGSVNQSFQKAPMSNPSNPAGSYKSPSLINQSDPGKMSGMPNQNVGLQKGVSHGKTGTNMTSVQHRNASHSVNQSQGSGGLSSKPANSVAVSSVGQSTSQKTPGSQTRVSSNSCHSSPSSTGRPSVNSRTNSVSGSGGNGSRAPPNHLAINRSMSGQSQKTGSVSSPRNQSPSNPSAPRFPGHSPQHKGSGSSPSSGSQRSGSTAQASSQRSSNSSQSGNNSRSSTSSQRASSSPQMHRAANSGSGSSPTQRPASTPGVADTRSLSGGSGQNPGCPVRPSSAGPRQGSSPLGPRQTSSPGQRLTCSPSAGRTSSPSAGGTSSPNGQKCGGGSGAGVSPLVSNQSPTSGLSDPAPLSRQNSSGNLNPSLVSRQNSSGNLNSTLSSRQNTTSSVNRTTPSRFNSSGSQNPAIMSRQNSSSSLVSTVMSKQASNNSVASSSVSPHSSANSSPSVVSRQNSSASINVSTGSQQSGSTKNTSTLSRQNSSNSLNSSSMSRQNPNSSSSLTPQSKQSSSSVPKTLTSSSVPSRSVSTVMSATASRQASTQSGPTSTSGKQLSSGSTLVSSATSASRTSSTAASSAQRTSSGSSVGSSSAGDGSRTLVNKTVVNGASGAKMSVGAGSDSGASKGASETKISSTTLTATSKSAVASVGGLPRSSGASSLPSVTASKSGTSSSSSVTAISSINKSSSLGSRTQNAASSTSSAKPSISSTASVTCSLSATSSAPNTATPTVSSKPSLSAAARGRKGSLSAIVDKLSRSASSGPNTDTGESLCNAAGTSALGGIAEVPVEQRKSAVEEEMEGGEQPTGGVKRSASESGLTAPTTEPKVQRSDSVKSASTLSYPSTAPLPAHTTPPHTTSMPSPLERHRSGSVGEKTFVPRDLEDIGLDLSLPKEKACRVEGAAMPSSRPDSRGRVSPRDSGLVRSASPAVGSEKGATKFNGDSSRDRSHSEMDVFKVPTPKTQCADEAEDSSSGRATNAINSRSFPSATSPLSDASSPENSLIIDCEVSTASSTISSVSLATANSIHASHKRITEINSQRSTPSGMDQSSPILSSGKASPSTSVRGVKNSPHTSPFPRLSSTQPSPDPAIHEARANSPCDIDDDLMDAALMGFNAS